MSQNTISSFSIPNVLRQSILQSQSGLVEVTKEIVTGRHADVGLALGGQTSQSISLQQENAYLTVLTAANNLAATRLNTTQSALSGIASSAQTFLQILVQASSGTSTASALQASAQANLSTLTSNLNSSYNGSYLFAGINSSVPPITDYYGASSPNQASVDSAFLATFGMTQSSSSVSTISENAMQSFLDNQYSSLFQGTSWSADWSSATDTVMTTQISQTQIAATSVSANQDAFKQLASAYTMVANLGTQNLNTDAYKAVVMTATKLMTSAISGLTDIQAAVGAAQSEIIYSNTQMSLNQSYLMTQVDNLESVDPVMASVRVTNLQTQIEAAYSLTAQLQQLTLVKYL